MDQIITRRSALAAGVPWYFTGKPCPKGHVAQRHVGGGCRECGREKMRRDRQYYREYNARYYANERNSEAKRKQRNLHSRKKHGLPEPTRPEPEYCECCGKRANMRLDHDHTTGAFRGWLCNDCNLAIGRLGDNIEGVERALQYLKREIA